MARNDCHGGIVEFRPPASTRVRISHEDEKFCRKFGAPIEQKSCRLGVVKSPPQRYSDLSSPLMDTRNRQQRSNPRARNWTSGGPGMQAIFLGSSNQRSCGTGVFLPRREGTGFQCSSKPAFSPVLLPARVVQALNLNVHELGLHINKPQPDQLIKNNRVKKMDENSKKQRKEASDICLSPEIFLPKEWTY